MAKKKKKSYAEFMRENYGATNDYVDNVQSKFRAKQDKKDDEDIAPVKTTEKKEDNKRTWFQKGAFDDGYQFGDIFKTISGTTRSITSNLFSGAAGIVEKTIDTAADITSDFGTDQYKEKVQKFIAKDIINEDKVGKVTEQIQGGFLNDIAAKILGTTVDKDDDTLLGEKTRSLVQSGGQLGATIGLQYAGVPWYVTTGVTSYGGALEEAYNEGASRHEAKINGLVNAGADILTEKLFGGSGLGEKGLINLSGLTKSISNKVVKVLADWGLDIASEGFEEVAAGFTTRLGEQLTYEKEDTWKELLQNEEAMDNYINQVGESLLGEEARKEYGEAFIGGAVLGGVMNVSNVNKSIKFNKDTNKLEFVRDYRTGLTENEQKVFDKVYENKITEAEKDGKKLTQKEKDKIYDEVMDSLEKGYISTDTIEEVLGGDTYNTYKSAVDNETTLQEEYNTLNKMKYGDMTGEQIDRRAELKQQLDELKANTNTADMKTKLGDEVFSLVKDSKLAESYNEKSRRGQAFEVDLSQYEEKYHGTLKKAVESGYLNNTRRTHEYVDLVAKISADKGVLFDFTNNENLKKSSFAVDGAIVNGYKVTDGDGNTNITINIDSPKYLNSVVGHEVTHIFEGTELYQTLADTITEYAKSKGDYQGRINKLSKLYKAEEVDSELVADLVGDYVFTDTDFVRKLSTENRNVFQKIYDEIKYLCKVATAGSKEARALEKVKKTFAEVYRESNTAQKNTAENSGVRYSITEPFVDNNGVQYDNAVLLDTDFFDGLSPRNWGGKLRDYVYNRSENNPFIMTVVDEKGKAQAIEFAKKGERVSKNGGKEHLVLNELIRTDDNISKLSTVHIDEVIEVSEENNPYYSSENSHGWLDANGWLHRNANVINAKNGNIYNITVDIAKTADGRTILYATKGKIKKVGQTKVNSLKLKGSTSHSNFKNSVAQNGADVKYSLSEAEAKIINTLTGEELDGNTYKVLKRLNNGESVSADEISNLKEVQEGTQKVNEMRQNFIDENPEFANIPLDDVGTYLLDSDERKQVKDKIIAERLQEGSFSGVDKDGNEEYNGSVKKGKRIDIVIGLPAAGKSSAIVNTLSEFYQSSVIDSDIIKSRFPEFNDGWGAMLVHEESSEMNVTLLDETMQLGNNIVLPIVGSKVSSVEKYIELANDYGYEINIHLNELPNGKATGRMLMRYFNKGRFIDPSYAVGLGNKPTEVYEQIKQRGDISGYSRWDNDVEYGQRPILVEVSDNNKLYGSYNGTSGTSGRAEVGRTNSETASGKTETNQIAPIKETSSNDGVFFDSKTKYSLSEQSEQPTKHGDLHISGEDVKLETEKQEVEEDITPVIDNTSITEEEAIEQARESLETIDDKDAPPEVEEDYYELPDTSSIDDKTLKNIGKELRETLALNPQETKAIQEIVQEYSTSEFPSKDELFETIKEKFSEKVWKERNNDVADVKRVLRTSKMVVADEIKSDIADYSQFRKSLGSKIKTSKEGVPVDVFYQELNETYPDFFPADIDNPTDQFLRICDVADMDIYESQSYTLDDGTIQEAVDVISNEVSGYKEDLNKTAAEDTAKENLEDIAPVKAQQVMDGTPYKVNEPKEPIKTVKVREAKKLQNLETELANNKQLLRESVADFDSEIERLSQEYIAKKDKNTQVANNLIRRIARLQRLKANVNADYSKRISDLETRIDETKANVKTERKAEILTEEPTAEKPKNKGWSKFVSNFVDKQSVFETLSLKTKNRELQAKANYMRYSEGRAQNFIGKGTNKVEALNDIRKKVEKAGHTEQLYEYLYHKHNADRMTLADRFDDVENKPVFGDYVTAEVSKQEIAKLEKANPKLKEYAESIYKINKHLRNMLVEGDVISQETADLWEEMYPHYVPVRRVGDSGLNINVALDTNKTGINAPVKRATGGNSDILPLFDTMAQRALQTYKAIAKNRFGVELKNTLGTTIEKSTTNLDEVIDSIDYHEDLLQEGKNGQSPTFTVFENGERVTFEITEEMYDALKPISKGMAYTNKLAQGISNFHRALLTYKNPTFMLTNAIKDTQDVLVNSQHPARTYANFPQAIGELLTGKGKYITEYMENGGEQNTYFENQTNTFEKEKSTLRKVVGFPLDAISKANNFIERIPRLAEYIASRKKGASVEVAMLDSARVTTNFAAGGDMTKFLNRNGATFLNASVQGAVQHVRNVREAKANGLKGWVGLATKVTLAGLPAMLLNGLLWDDDEEYEELSDYVKDNYYIVGKTSNGNFIRIPKGRASAVIQDAFEQIGNALTGNDEVDFANFFDLVMNNIAPNNPIDNNIFAPIMQVANNETWYGEDLVPTRLQDLPKAEQFDESTDSISKWLGENLNASPYKINYLLNQYSGGVGDVFLPMLTPEAESGDNSLSGNLFAPLKDKFTTDSTMNNQNISDFYDTVDELTANAKSSKATDKDILMSKYMNSVNSELGELYGRKREIQNDTTLNDTEKYNQVKNIQEQINTLARNSLNSYQNVSIGSNYATVGDKHYRLDEGTWTKISDKQYERQQEVTQALGITPDEYWSKTDISFIPMNDSKYEYAYENPGKYGISKVVGDYETYKSYISDLYDLKADKDENGDTIMGSAKEKKLDYINNLDLDYGQRIILYRSLYSSKQDKADYNSDIVDYLDSREDISWEEMKAILEELDFTVNDDGTVEW